MRVCRVAGGKRIDASGRRPLGDNLNGCLALIGVNENPLTKYRDPRIQRRSFQPCWCLPCTLFPGDAGRYWIFCSIYEDQWMLYGCEISNGNRRFES